MPMSPDSWATVPASVARLREAGPVSRARRLVPLARRGQRALAGTRSVCPPHTRQDTKHVVGESPCADVLPIERHRGLPNLDWRYTSALGICVARSADSAAASDVPVIRGCPGLR